MFGLQNQFILLEFSHIKGFIIMTINYYQQSEIVTILLKLEIWFLSNVRSLSEQSHMTLCTLSFLYKSFKFCCSLLRWTPLRWRAGWCGPAPGRGPGGRRCPAYPWCPTTPGTTSTTTTARVWTLWCSTTSQTATCSPSTSSPPPGDQEIPSPLRQGEQYLSIG